MKTQTSTKNSTLNTPPNAFKYMASTLAAIGAANTANATIVQISLTGNTLTDTANNLVADFTGDGNDDFTLAGIAQKHNPPQEPKSSPGFTTITSSGSTSYVSGTYTPGSPGSYSVQLSANNSQIYAQKYVTSMGATNGGYTSSINGLHATDGLIAITFTDVNYGGLIQGWLDVSVDGFNTAITLQRIIWDDANLDTAPAVSATDPAFATATPVPEPSGLALLALGAGGLITRRRRKDV
jgi:hypothetical protein